MKFANCGLSGKGIGVLLREGLLANIDVSYPIETLDVSNNRFVHLLLSFLPLLFILFFAVFN